MFEKYVINFVYISLDLPSLKSYITRSWTCSEVVTLELSGISKFTHQMKDLPNFTTLDLGLYSFANTKSLILNSNLFIIILLYSIDLPCLSQFSMKKNCFSGITSVSLSGMFLSILYYKQMCHFRMDAMCVILVVFHNYKRIRLHMILVRLMIEK